MQNFIALAPPLRLRSSRALSSGRELGAEGGAQHGVGQAQDEQQAALAEHTRQVRHPQGKQFLKERKNKKSFAHDGGFM